MATEVGICNAALQLIKNTKRITSLTQGTKEANACEEIYTEMRDLLLEMHTWNFATHRVQLARLTETPAFGWSYYYQLPSDFIRVSAVYGDSSGRAKIDYKVEGSRLSTDAASVYLLYVRRISDPNLMTAGFRTALAKLLGSRLAPGIANSATRGTELKKEFEDEDLIFAKSSDSLQDMPDELPESSWVTVRNGGSHVSPGQPE